MQYAQAKQGRVFVLRLEDGEVVHEVLENFAATHGIKRAAVMFLGASQAGSRMVSGPADETARPMPVNFNVVGNVSETHGVGTIFPDANGRPTLHMHASFGHKQTVLTGCIRAGVKVWHVGEAVIFELETIGERLLDDASGFDLLTFKDK